MVCMPDFNDLRYLNEVGWFLYREKYGYNHFTDSYAKERLLWSPMLLDEVLGLCGGDRKWVEDKAVVTVGCGCTGDLAAWPAAIKIAVDPLLHVYQKLDMLIADVPLPDGYADMVICRNALDHMSDPREGLSQIRRILKNNQMLFLSVDIGGAPAPDEPSPFTRESLLSLLQDHFEIVSERDGQPPDDEWWDCSVRILAQKKVHATPVLSKERILEAHETHISQTVPVMDGGCGFTRGIKLGGTAGFPFSPMAQRIAGPRRLTARSSSANCAIPKQRWRRTSERLSRSFRFPTAMTDQTWRRHAWLC